jgi:sulfite reductase alpha subunit-like flavoprotein
VKQPCAGKPITLRAALARYADLLSPVSKPALQALSAFAEGEEQARLRHLLSPDGAAEYKAWHQQSRSLLEVFEEFSSCRPPLGKLLFHVHGSHPGVSSWRRAFCIKLTYRKSLSFSMSADYLVHS